MDQPRGKVFRFKISQQPQEPEGAPIDPAALPPQLAFLSKWERYRVLEFLGEGSMGRVYKAYDPSLHRNVALKFLRDEDPDSAERLIQEARAQARIEHDHVCGIYEVGEVEGKPFIAMQYVAGPTLKQSYPDLNLQQKLRVMRAVSDGVQQAHRLGLIHRDLKPSNILLDFREGVAHPYVLDFGLVREIGAEGLTATGEVLGTPAYMAPEQARGTPGKVDRRTDVYGLGATLYEILTGQPLFQGSSGAEVLVKVLQEEPPGLRKLNASVPADVETVVMKCLEKEPERRYDSARELGDELQRMLDGEPIHARPVQWPEKLLRKAKRNRAASILLAIGVIAILTLAGLVVRERAISTRQTQAAQEFGRRIEKMDSLLRYSYTLPLHDVRPEQALVRNEMQDIARSAQTLGPAVMPAAEYALGRGALALRNYTEARQHLQNAWNGGYRTEESAYALGTVLGALYQQGLQEAYRISNKELQAARKKEVEQQLREPALTYLRTGRSPRTVSPEFGEGLIAFYEARYGDAIALAKKAYSKLPWLYEARKLEGDAFSQRGKGKQLQGDLQGAESDLKQAAIALASAIQIGRSDPAVYESEAQRWQYVLDLEAARGYTGGEPFDQALAACDNLLQSDPASSRGYSTKAGILLRLGLLEASHGTDPETAFDNGYRQADRAVSLDAFNRDGYLYQGSILREKAQYRISRGQDAGDLFDRSLDRFQTAIKIEPNFPLGYSNLGLTYMSRAGFELRKGRDPRISLDLAVESYKKALQWNPTFASAYNNISWAEWRRALYESKTPGLDPLPALQVSIESAEKALQLNPQLVTALNNLSIARLMQATALLEAQKDPAEAVSSGLHALDRALKIDPNDDDSLMFLGKLHLITARYQSAHGDNAEQAFQSCEASLKKAIVTNPGNAQVYHAYSQYERWKAEDALRRGKPASIEIKDGLQMAQRALSINAEMFESTALQGVFHLLLARQTSGASRQKQARLAVDLLQKGIAGNPLFKKDYDPALKEAQLLLQ